MQLIDVDSPQEETDTRRADVVEVIPVSFDSETLPREKTQRVIRKVQFSYPFPHLHHNFLFEETTT